MKLLRKHGVTEHTRRGTGHRALRREVAPGQSVQCSLFFHGDSETIGIPVIKAIRGRLRLSAQDGVSDQQFYGHKKKPRK